MTERQEEIQPALFWTNQPKLIEIIRRRGYELVFDEMGTRKTGRDSFFITARGPIQAHDLYSILDNQPTISK